MQVFYLSRRKRKNRIDISAKNNLKFIHVTIKEEEYPMAAKFVIFCDKAKKYRFRLVAPNGEIIASGEAYESKASCVNGIKSIQKNAPTAAIEDETVKKEEPKKAPVKKEAAKKPAAKKPVAKKTTAKKPAAKKPAAKKPPAKKI